MRLFSILNGICQYIAARNKTLWSGSWSEGSMTVPDTAKYRTFLIKFGARYMFAINNGGNRIVGTYFFVSNNGQNIYQNQFEADISGDIWTIRSQTQVGHLGGAGHPQITQVIPGYVVEEIVGLEPILSAFVTIGGGRYYLVPEGWGRHEVIRHNSRPGRTSRTGVHRKRRLGHPKISEWCGDMLPIHNNYDHNNHGRRVGVYAQDEYPEHTRWTIYRNTQDVWKLLCGRSSVGSGECGNTNDIQNRTILSNTIHHRRSMAVFCFRHRSLEIALKGVAA